MAPAELMQPEVPAEAAAEPVAGSVDSVAPSTTEQGDALGADEGGDGDYGDYGEPSPEEGGDEVHTSWVDESSGGGSSILPKVLVAGVLAVGGVAAFVFMQQGSEGPAGGQPLTPDMNSTPGYQDRIFDSSASTKTPVADTVDDVATTDPKPPVTPGRAASGASTANNAGRNTSPEVVREVAEGETGAEVEGLAAVTSTESVETSTPEVEAGSNTAGSSTTEVASAALMPVWRRVGETLPPGTVLDTEGTADGSEGGELLAAGLGGLVVVGDDAGEEGIESDPYWAELDSDQPVPSANAWTTDPWALATERGASETEESFNESGNESGAESEFGGEADTWGEEVAATDPESDALDVVAETFVDDTTDTTESTGDTFEATEVALAEPEDTWTESSDEAWTETTESGDGATEFVAEGVDEGVTFGEAESFDEGESSTAAPTEVAIETTTEDLIDEAAEDVIEIAAVTEPVTETTAESTTEPISEPESELVTELTEEPDMGEATTLVVDSEPAAEPQLETETLVAAELEVEPAAEVEPVAELEPVVEEAPVLAGGFGPALPKGVQAPLVSHQVDTPETTNTRVRRIESQQVVSPDSKGPRPWNEAERRGFWLEETVPPLEAIQGKKKILTPQVGMVRVILKGNEIFQGRLYAIGEGRVWINSKSFGQMGLEGPKVTKIVRIDASEDAPVSGATDAPGLGGLESVRVKTPGGILFGKVIARDKSHTTLVTDDGTRVTLASDQVEFLDEAPTVTLKRAKTRVGSEAEVEQEP